VRAFVGFRGIDTTLAHGVVLYTARPLGPSRPPQNPQLWRRRLTRYHRLSFSQTPIKLTTDTRSRCDQPEKSAKTRMISSHCSLKTTVALSMNKLFTHPTDRAHATWVEECTVLDAVACADWSARVMDLRAQWTARHESLPFFTLGMAAYLDAVPRAARTNGHPPYYAQALRQHHNRILKTNFWPLLTQVCEALGQWANKRGHCSETRTALPGFHIHLEHPIFTQSVASRHRDLQFQLVFPNRSIEPHQVFTFTLPLSLPEGSGLNLWSDQGMHFHPYQLGRMVIHSGLQPHQGVLFAGSHRPPRIMLQGHALIEGDEILLYW